MKQPQNPRSIQFQEDLSEEELVRDWTLSERDRAQVLRCRGDDNRRRFAIQLCALRHTGRFLEDFAGVPVRILNYISRQLDLAPALSLGLSDREATQVGYEQRLRDYLDYSSFDSAARANLEEHLRSQLALGMLPEGLKQQAEDVLRFWRVHPACGIHAESLGGFDRRHWPPGDLRLHRNTIERGATPSAESDR